MRNIFVANTLFLIFTAFAFINDNIAMPVFVYKRIAAQPFEVALAQTEELIQFCRFTAITTPFASAASCTRRP